MLLVLVSPLVVWPATATASPSPSDAATPRPGKTPPPDVLVRANSDAELPLGETVQAVLVFGGDADIAGTVRTSVFVVGGDVLIRSTAVVGADLTERDASIVVIGGKVKESPGAQITGTTQVVSLTAPRIDIAGALWHRIRHPGISITDWFGRTIFYSLVALAVVALLPRPTRAIRDRALAAPLASLGWGSLTAFMALVVALILAATIIGLVVVIPAALVSPFVGLFVHASAAFALGDLLLRRVWHDQENRYLAAVTGIIVLGLVGLIPVVGGLAVMLAWLTALGAGAVSLVEWRRTRQARNAADGPPVAPETFQSPAGPTPQSPAASSSAAAALPEAPPDAPPAAPAGTSPPDVT